MPDSREHLKSKTLMIICSKNYLTAICATNIFTLSVAWTNAKLIVKEQGISDAYGDDSHCQYGIQLKWFRMEKMHFNYDIIKRKVFLSTV